jgi:hypothetical protein
MKRSGIKPLLFATVLLLFSCAVFGADIYPVGVGMNWRYTGYFKDSPDKKIYFTAGIISKEKIDGKEYFYYSAPKVDTRFMVKTDKNGAYMKLTKYPFPVLKFLTVDVYLTPEIKFINFPMKVGDVWKQEIKAVADLIPFKLNRKIYVKFEVVGTDPFKMDGVEYTAYHIRMERDEGGPKLRIEDNWFVDGIGFVRGETPEYFIELYKYESGQK